MGGNIQNAYNISNKELISGIYEEILRLNNIMLNNNILLTTEYIWMANKYMKKALNH